MFAQLVLGTFLILTTVVSSGLGYLLMEVIFQRLHPWLTREPHVPKQVLMLCIASLGILALVSSAVWIWALAFWLLGSFPSFEDALYFSLVAYTTLGFGDILLPHDWRLLGGMLAANGFINFGLSTATLIEAMRQLRINQAQALQNRQGADRSAASTDRN